MPKRKEKREPAELDPVEQVVGGPFSQRRKGRKKELADEPYFEPTFPVGPEPELVEEWFPPQEEEEQEMLDRASSRDILDDDA